MTWTRFASIYIPLALTMVLCRALPIFLLKDRDLPESVRDALSLIPVAAFAALVANDLFVPGMLAQGFWPGALPLIAALVVCFVARLSKSLVWSAVVGVVVYALLSLI